VEVFGIEIFQRLQLTVYRHHGLDCLMTCLLISITRMSSLILHVLSDLI